MNPATWTALITSLFAIIKECKAAKQPPEQIAQQIRNPRGLALLKLDRAAREASGMTRREWRRDDAKRNAILAEINAERVQLTDADVAELVAGDDD